MMICSAWWHDDIMVTFERDCLNDVPDGNLTIMAMQPQQAVLNIPGLTSADQAVSQSAIKSLPKILPV